MKTLLAMRSLKARLAVAYMATAVHTFSKCETGNTWTRTNEWSHSANTDKTVYHPYTQMWMDIGKFYDKMDFAEMSDEDIISRYNGSLRVGFTYLSKPIEASAVQKAHHNWEQFGWARYENRRAGRRNVAYKAAPYGIMVAGLCFGVFVNPRG